MTAELNKVVIVAGARTPFLDSAGDYAPLMTYQLGAVAISGLMDKTHLGPDAIDMLTMGTVLHETETPNVAREAMLTAGLNSTTPAYTVSMAGLSATAGFATLVDQIALGRVQSGIAAGVESFSDIPIRFSQPVRRAAMKARQNPSAKHVAKLLTGLRPKDLIPDMPSGTDFTTGKTMGVCAEQMVQRIPVSRKDCDAFAARSHRLALEAIAAGHYDEEIVPVPVPGTDRVVSRDNTPRADCTEARIANMPTLFDRDNGVVTAAGSSRFTDGAAALLVTSETIAEQQGLTPLAEVIDYQLAGVHDLETEMLLGPALSIPTLLKRNGLSMADIDVWELHEAFAAQILVNVACMAKKEYAATYYGGEVPGVLPLERLNAWGGSLALGNPFAATGIRLLHTACRRLQVEQGEYAVVSSCAGGGLGAAVLLKRSAG